METHAIAVLALAFACILHLELRSLKKRHEQLRRDFDDFINEILQKSSNDSENKEL